MKALDYVSYSKQLLTQGLTVPKNRRVSITRPYPPDDL